MGIIKADGILFDLDGTLWDSSVPAAEVWSRVAAEYPEITDEISPERLSSFYGLPLEDIARNMFTSVPYEKSLSVMERCVKEQCPYLVEHKGRLFGDVEGSLRRLRAAGFKLFIVSNCRSGYIEAFLEGHGFKELIDDHLCPGDTGLLKADNNRRIIEKWGLASPVYVGDTAGDMEAAEASGVPFIFADYGFGKADRYAARLSGIGDLENILERFT